LFGLSFWLVLACQSPGEDSLDDDSGAVTDGTPTWWGQGWDTDETEPPDRGCQNVLEWMWPVDGATGVYNRAFPEVHIAEVEPAVLGIYDEGQWFDTILYMTGTRIHVAPIAPMRPNYTYTLDLDWTCGNERIQFTTGTTGTPINVGDTPNHGWALSFAGATVREPGWYADEVTRQLDDLGLLMDLTLYSDLNMSGRIAWSSGGDQDRCQPSMDVDAMWSNPYVSTPLEDVGLSDEEGLRLHDVSFAASVTADGRSMEGGRLQAMVDTRDWPAPDGYVSVCEALAEHYVWCRECPGDGYEACTPLRVEQVTGSASPAPVERVTASDVSANPTCSD